MKECLTKYHYPNNIACGHKEFLSSHWPDSNRRPTHYECVALPTALQWHPNSNCHSFDATRLLPKQQPCHHDLTGNRTRVYAVRGRRLSRLTIRPFVVCCTHQRQLVYNTIEFLICPVFFKKNQKSF